LYGFLLIPILAINNLLTGGRHCRADIDVCIASQLIICDSAGESEYHVDGACLVEHHRGDRDGSRVGVVVGGRTSIENGGVLGRATNQGRRVEGGQQVGGVDEVYCKVGQGKAEGRVCYYVFAE